MVEFFRGMDFIDIATCIFALIIAVGAIIEMAYIYIYTKKGKINGK